MFVHSSGFDTMKDPCNCVYLALLLAGVGFLLPYNSFVSAVDYFQAKFPGTTVIMDMRLVVLEPLTMFFGY